MSEEQTAQTQQPSEQEIINAAAPQITEDKIQEIVKSAISEAQAKQPNQALSKDQVSELLEKQRVEIAKSIAGVKEENPNAVHPLVEAFANNPEQFLDKYADVVKDRFKKEQAIEKEKQTQFDKAYLKVLADRPDVTSDQSAMKVFLNFYDETSEDKNEEARFKAALDSYDVFLEKQNVGDAKSRIEKARGMSLASNTSKDSQPAKRSMEEILMEEQKEQKEAFLRSRGRS